ncbi:hypothetical protein VTN77DRAFT_3387 [Rasamsonia byssochlamydoides]|uniref:uncharacterized protein n=1 Tax=Rasamsonia byssochlamydoides TaxID=89139 RepID=UPI0037422553
MLETQFLSTAECESLVVVSGTTFNSFSLSYTGSRKEPDLYILPYGQTLPSLVGEAGWSESRAQLQRDMELWLRGGAGVVNLVFLSTWTKNNGRVSGTLEVWDLDRTGNARLLQSEGIFPIPPPQPTRLSESPGDRLWAPLCRREQPRRPI